MHWTGACKHAVKSAQQCFSRATGMLLWLRSSVSENVPVLIGQKAETFVAHLELLNDLPAFLLVPNAPCWECTGPLGCLLGSGTLRPTEAGLVLAGRALLHRLPTRHWGPTRTHSPVSVDAHVCVLIYDKPCCYCACCCGYCAYCCVKGKHSAQGVCRKLVPPYTSRPGPVLACRDLVPPQAQNTA